MYTMVNVQTWFSAMTIRRASWYEYSSISSSVSSGLYNLSHAENILAILLCSRTNKLWRVVKPNQTFTLESPKTE